MRRILCAVLLLPLVLSCGCSDEESTDSIGGDADNDGALDTAPGDGGGDDVSDVTADDGDDRNEDIEDSTELGDDVAVDVEVDVRADSTDDVDMGSPCEGLTCSGHGTCVVEDDGAACVCHGGYHAEGLDCVEDSYQVPTEGLVAYYPFNGNADDESENDHHGDANNLTPTDDRFGNAVAAYDFDGDGYVEVADSDDFHLANITISVWVSPVEDPAERNIISKDDMSRGYYLSFADEIRFAVGDGSWHTITEAHSLPYDQWSHLVGTYDGERLALFINGELADELAWEGSISYGERPLQIGRNGYYTDRLAHYFMGSLDDIRIYDRALSSSEVEALYSEGDWE